MVELREIRANRLGFTFRHTLRRDPFRFASDGFLLLILYGITRPRPSAKQAPSIVATGTKPGRGPAGDVGLPWGNDDPDVPVQANRPSPSGLIWPTKRYQDPSPWELLQRKRER